MCLAAHLLFELGGVTRILRIPHRQWWRATVAGPQLRVIRPQFLLRRRLVVVRQVTQEQKGQHVIAEIVRVHRPAQLIGNAPQGVAQLFLIVFGHGGGVRLLLSSGSSNMFQQFVVECEDLLFFHRLIGPKQGVHEIEDAAAITFERIQKNGWLVHAHQSFMKQIAKLLLNILALDGIDFLQHVNHLAPQSSQLNVLTG